MDEDGASVSHDDDCPQCWEELVVYTREKAFAEGMAAKVTTSLQDDGRAAKAEALRGALEVLGNVALEHHDNPIGVAYGRVEKRLEKLGG